MRWTAMLVLGGLLLATALPVQADGNRGRHGRRHVIVASGGICNLPAVGYPATRPGAARYPTYQGYPNAGYYPTYQGYPNAGYYPSYPGYGNFPGYPNAGYYPTYPGYGNYPGYPNYSTGNCGTRGYGGGGTGVRIQINVGGSPWGVYGAPGSGYPGGQHRR